MPSLCRANPRIGQERFLPTRDEQITKPKVLENGAGMVTRFLSRASHVLTVLLVLTGCSSFPRTPYSAADAASARVLDLRELRKYADEPASSFLKEMRARNTVRSRTRNYLALSGGGADGAYGAGVLNGWTAAGTRPEFSVVSGVSTGALIAPFAFLGPGYDASYAKSTPAASPRASLINPTS